MLFTLTFQRIELSRRTGPQKYPMALEGPRRRSPPLGVGAVEPVQEVEGAEVLVELEVVKVVVLARLEEGQVVAGVLDQCVDHHVGVPGNLGDCDGRGSSNHNQTSISLLIYRYFLPLSSRCID